MKPFPSTGTLVSIGCVVWLVALGCRVADVVAQAGPAPTRTVTRTVPRPTFTSVPPTPPPTDVPPPTVAAPATPTRGPVPRPVPAHTSTPVKSATPVPPPPTPNPDAGNYYRAIVKGCVTSPNTRIQGTVYDEGVPQNEIKVRVSVTDDGSPVMDDSFTGRDPYDIKHVDPSRVGKYQLGLSEGAQIDGTWFVFIVNPNDELLTRKVQVATTKGPGCNVWTVDFAHP